MTKTLIRNASILSMDPHVGEIESGDVLIEGEHISGVGESLPEADAETIDAAGMILLPGLVNAHMHTWQTALRGLGGDWGGRSYFEIAHETLAPRYRPEDIYIATLTGAWAQMEAGATTLFDWCHNNPTPEHTDAGIDALEESGIRALFGHGTPKPQPQEGEPHYSQIPHPESEIKRLRTGRLSNDDGLITLAMAILGADYSPLEVALHDMRLAREYGLLSSAHIWGDASRKVKGGYHTLAREGVLGPDHNLVHCNYVEDEELRVILDSGASITATPSAEMQTNRGEAVCGRVSALGGRPSIGVDLETYVSGNMLHAMRHALQVQRIFDNRRLDADTYRAPALAFSARDGHGGENRLHHARQTGRPHPHPQKRPQHDACCGRSARRRLLCGALERGYRLHRREKGESGRKAACGFRQNSPREGAAHRIRAVDYGSGLKRRWTNFPDRRKKECVGTDLRAHPEHRGAVCVNRSNVGRQTQRPTLRNDYFVMPMPRY